MRNEFFDLLHNEMKTNRDIFFVTSDMGYGLCDKIRDDFPQRFFNTQAAEQCMLDIGVGLTLAGKIAVLYSITPFLLHRPFESIKLYLEHEQIPVKLCGSGRGRDYLADGISHWEDIDLVSNLNVDTYCPYDLEQLKEDFLEFISSKSPCFFSLKR